MCKKVSINLKQLWIEIFLILLLIFIPIMIKADIINVPLDQSSIQAGIDSAAYYADTVLVDTGIYLENIDFSGKSVVVASYYLINQDPYYIINTIIDGSSPSVPDTASCVKISSGQDSTTILEGFTLTNGLGTMWVDPSIPAYKWRGGGGIFIFQSSPTIRNNIIIENKVDDMIGVDGAQGGGLLTFGGNPIVENNIIMSNEAFYGAGVVIDWSGIVLRNNIIYNNTGGNTYGGAGIWTLGNIDIDPLFEDSLFLLSDPSPCIDLGNPDIIYNDPEDSLNPSFALFPSKGELRNDIGAYGGPYRKELHFSSVNVSEEDLSNIEYNDLIIENSLNNIILINYTVRDRGFMSLKLYNKAGRRVDVLINRYENPGNYEIFYDTKDLTFGDYFLVFWTSDNIFRKKIIILN